MYPFRADLRVVVPQFLPRLDVGGIYMLSSTGKSSADGTVDYGVNPCLWALLPNEGVMIWKVRHPATTAESSLPATVVVPASGRSTVTSSSSADTSKVPVVDNKGTQAQGGDLTNPVDAGGSAASGYTEHWVYFNKSAGIFRLLGVTAQGASAPTAAESGSVKNSK